jgi:hypothetical protein
MSKKKKFIKEAKKDHTISMVILGVVAVLAIVGLVLLFSAAQNSVGLGIYGGAIRDEGSFRHANIRGTPTWVQKEGSATEYEVVYGNTPFDKGIQGDIYGTQKPWDAYIRNQGVIRKCAEYPGAVLYRYPVADFYKLNSDWKCDGEFMLFEYSDPSRFQDGWKGGVCCQIRGTSII